MKHINHESIKTIFEVGARDLIDSVIMSHKFPDATIYSYECNPLTLDLCRANIKMAREGSVVLNEIPLSSRVEELEFHNFLADNNPGASSFYKRLDYEETQKTMFTIKTSTLQIELDKYNLKEIDLLCMDVQGYELNILKGVELDKYKISHIILEAPNGLSVYEGAPSREEIETFMENHNYELKEVIYENGSEDNVLFSLRS